eukprot:3552952-Rhodomonas_salina.2
MAAKATTLKTISFTNIDIPTVPSCPTSPKCEMRGAEICYGNSPQFSKLGEKLSARDHQRSNWYQSLRLVQGPGFRVQGPGFRVQGFGGCRV